MGGGGGGGRGEEKEPGTHCLSVLNLNVNLHKLWMLLSKNCGQAQ